MLMKGLVHHYTSKRQIYLKTYQGADKTIFNENGLKNSQSKNRQEHKEFHLLIGQLEDF